MCNVHITRAMCTLHIHVSLLQPITGEAFLVLDWMRVMFQRGLSKLCATSLPSGVSPRADRTNHTTVATLLSGAHEQSQGTLQVFSVDDGSSSSPAAPILDIPAS